MAQSLTIKVTNNTEFPMVEIAPGMQGPITTGSTANIKLDQNGSGIYYVVILNFTVAAVVIGVECQGQNRYHTTALGIPPLTGIQVSSDPTWPNNDLNPTLTLTVSSD
jgi:hypothetical protein